MRTIFLLLTFCNTYRLLACGGGDFYYGMWFYSLFDQTNIAAKEYYPFLKDEFNPFYKQSAFEYQNAEQGYPKGNMALWKEQLKGWSFSEIQKGVYAVSGFNWNNKTSKIEKRAKQYLDFAQKCSDIFSYRNQRLSWDYDAISKTQEIDATSLLEEANQLLLKENNEQLIARYYYQIIRIFHYSKQWEDGITFFESRVENRLPKNEIYYYILDQVAGCYYSTGHYEKAAYLFMKVINNSLDRKQSAYISYGFCANKGAEGKLFFTGIEDEKNYLLIKGLRTFSSEISDIAEFIKLDANDPRVELIFVRFLNGVENEVWRKNIGITEGSLPDRIERTNYKQLLEISEAQSKNAKVVNSDFWKLASSYLSFIGNDIATAKEKLKTVQSFLRQKKDLEAICEVFGWKKITAENEAYLTRFLKEHPLQKESYEESVNDTREFVLDKVANIYYTNNELGKAFLVHNSLGNVEHMGSIELLESLEEFYLKPNKNSFENKILEEAITGKDFLEFINFHKGVYYIHNQEPQKALHFFEKSYTEDFEYASISNLVFSNNVKECFSCPENEVMEDEVFKASAFSFIENDFSQKELASYLIELEKLTSNDKTWKAKLANYLLGNFYFNISNTGYFRGVLTGRYRQHYEYFNFTKKEANNAIKQRSGFNLSNAINYPKNYFALATKAKEYYKKVIDLSSDKELNARCYYLMAKCELNDHYNNGNRETYTVKLTNNAWRQLKLPKTESFDKLKYDFGDTKFHKRIIKECSYFKHYSAAF